MKWKNGRGDSCLHSIWFCFFHFCDFYDSRQILQNVDKNAKCDPKMLFNSKGPSLIRVGIEFLISSTIRWFAFFLWLKCPIASISFILCIGRAHSIYFKSKAIAFAKNPNIITPVAATPFASFRLNSHICSQNCLRIRICLFRYICKGSLNVIFYVTCAVLRQISFVYLVIVVYSLWVWK